VKIKMKRYIVEKDFIVDGFRCIITGSYMGHRCGYIAIPKDHELYETDYDEIELDVHGGLTYADYSNNGYPVKTEEQVWWIGFDCGHYCDAKDLELIKSFGEDNKEIKVVLDIESKYPTHGTVRTVEYVEKELVEAVEQIIKYQESNWEAEWTGSYPCLCSGEWIIKYKGIDLKLPEDIKKSSMNTYGEYQSWHFDENYMEQFDSYTDGLNFEDWKTSNGEWLKELFNQYNISESELENLYKAIQSEDFRNGSCGGCI
jgi:hypothetical protein